MNRLQRAKEIQQAIGHLLLQEWDPIGVREEPECIDEYDSYVGGVYRLLASHASAEVLAEHLAHIERDSMGFEKSTATPLLPLARKLLQLDVTLGAAGLDPG
jgi:hypothetical protein